MLPLPSSKFTSAAPIGDFAPAPLDALSLENGVCKYDHPQALVETSFYRYAFAVLDRFFPCLVSHSQLISYEDACEIAKNPDHCNKSSGYPYSFKGAGTKGVALQKFSREFIETQPCVINATLKDELRKVGADARLFRMQSLHDYLEALQLFSKQNDYLMCSRNLFSTPIFVKYCTPGFDLSRMYNRLRRHGGALHDADAASWDANFPLLLAELICHWRSRDVSPEIRKRMIMYYRKIYNGVTNVGGVTFPLVGQSSGHLLTTLDNSLGNIIAMSYHAYRNNLSVEQFYSDVLFYCCGDDLVWSDRTQLFTPWLLSDSYRELGIYLEFSTWEDQKMEELTFVGTFPIVKGNVVRYYGRVEKLRSSCNFYKRGNSPIDHLAKLVSAAMLVFYHPVFPEFVDNARAYFMAQAQKDPTLLLSPVANGYLRCLNSSFLTQLYDEFESTTTPIPVGIARAFREF